MTRKAETLSVVMPVYNEEEIIGSVIQSWYQTLESLDVDFVIRCYNDGSRDKTQEILDRLSKAHPRLSVVNKSNTGHGPTILQGYLDSSDTDWTFQVDSDDEIRADQFEVIWRHREEYDFILGKRSHEAFPISRRIISFVARQVIRYGFSSAIQDVNAPFRLFRSKALLPLIASIPKDTFAPNILITGLVSAHGLRAMEVDIKNGMRNTGTVSIKHLKLLRVAFRSFSESIQFALGYRSAR